MSNAAPPPPPPSSTPPSPPSSPPPSATPPSSTPPGGGFGGAAKSSGMPLWGKIAIGCGCLLLLGVGAFVATVGFGIKKAVESEAGANIWNSGKKAIEAAKAFEAGDKERAAQLMIEMNPDFEVVENNPGEGRITVRVKSSGEVGTIDYSELEKGRFSFESESGGSFQVGGSEDGNAEITYTDEAGNTGRIGAGVEDLPSWVPVYPDAGAKKSGGFQGMQNGQATGMVGYETQATFDEVLAWYEERFESEGYTIERTTMSSGESRLQILNAKKEGVEQLAVTIQQEGTGPVNLGLQYTGPPD